MNGTLQFIRVKALSNFFILHDQSLRGIGMGKLAALGLAFPLG
jgi:hypothetical protein